MRRLSSDLDDEESPLYFERNMSKCRRDGILRSTSGKGLCANKEEVQILNACPGPESFFAFDIKIKDAVDKSYFAW